jgi:hypothetical protein
MSHESERARFAAGTSRVEYRGPRSRPPSRVGIVERRVPNHTEIECAGVGPGERPLGEQVPDDTAVRDTD